MRDIILLICSKVNKGTKLSGKAKAKEQEQSRMPGSGAVPGFLPGPFNAKAACHSG